MCGWDGLLNTAALLYLSWPRLRSRGEGGCAVRRALPGPCRLGMVPRLPRLAMVRVAWEVLPWSVLQLTQVPAHAEHKAVWVTL
jgi:hypothetical protein